MNWTCGEPVILEHPQTRLLVFPFTVIQISGVGGELAGRAQSPRRLSTEQKQNEPHCWTVWVPDFLFQVHSAFKHVLL